MSVWEIVLIGAALAMDAVAVSMTDGMTEPRMRPAKALLIALTFAAFQFAMPVLGYYGGYAFAALIGRVAPWLSFVLLAFIGGKMIADCALELRERKRARQTGLPREGQAGLPHDGRTGLPHEGQTGLPREGQARLPRKGQARLPRKGQAGLPRKGQAGLPREGQAGLPREGQTGLPRQGQAGLPREGQTGLPREGQTGLPREGQTGLPREGRTGLPREGRSLGVGKLFAQGVATSLDALAVGVTLLAAQTQSALPMHAAACAAVIGAVTFVLSYAAVCLGKRAGDRFSGVAGIAGGVVLIAVGLKILLEGVL